MAIHVTLDDGRRVALPPALTPIIDDLLGRMADGSAVAVVPLDTELTTQQAADLLNVSRPFLVKLLDQGALPCRMVGSHRRVRLADLQQFKQRARGAQDAAMDELAAQAQELGLGY